MAILLSRSSGRGYILIVTGDVVAMMVFHTDDIEIAATEEVTGNAVNALNQTFLTKHLGEVEWYMDTL